MSLFVISVRSGGMLPISETGCREKGAFWWGLN